MRILIFVAVLLAVYLQSDINVQADVIECDFNDHEFNFPLATHRSYRCGIESIKQDENQNVITGYHETGKSDSDVNVVYYRSPSDSINLTNFDSFFCQKFPNLDRIFFINFKPANLVENAIHGCPNLSYIQLDIADIKQIPDNFFSNNLNLIFLSLGESRLETLPENIFKPLTKLSSLYLDKNNLSILSHAWFDSLRNLKKLNLASNKIENLPKNIFANLEKLETLWLRNNNLVTIHANSIGEKPLLTEVYLSNNKITSIDENFVDNTAVNWLLMDGNICIDEEIRPRDKMKEKLQKCFENYQPRPADPSTSSAALPKHKKF